MQSAALHRSAHALNPALAQQLAWYATGAIAAFLIPFIFSSTLDLNHDVYYLVYFSAAAAFLAAYATATQVDLRAVFSRSWRLSLGLGVLAGAFLVFNVVNGEDSTPHPDGLYFAFSIAWRGVVYGAVDALVLTAFPAAVAYALMSGRLDTLVRRGLFAGLALVLVLIITASYHLGYEQFRQDGVGGPEIGNTIISVPVLLTANPLGSVVAHASMHVAADVHAYETDLFLPPRTFVKAAEGSFPSEVQLTDSDSGREVRLAEGGTLTVALPSNPSTGYSWTFAGTLPDELRLAGEPALVPAGSTQPVVGAGGTQVFTFVAAAAGDVRLELVYSRPFEPGSQERTFAVEVVIR